MNTASPFYDIWIGGLVAMTLVGVFTVGLSLLVFGRKSLEFWVACAFWLVCFLLIAASPLFSPDFRDIFPERLNNEAGIQSSHVAVPDSELPIREPDKDGRAPTFWLESGIHSGSYEINGSGRLVALRILRMAARKQWGD